MARTLTALSAWIVLALSTIAPAAAGPFEDGLAAYGKGDYSNAMRHWRPLADRGNAAAQSNVALLYGRGQGVPRDYVQAYMWASLSAAQGHQDGAKNRDGIAKGMTPAQITEAKKRASAWKPLR